MLNTQLYFPFPHMQPSQLYMLKKKWLEGPAKIWKLKGQLGPKVFSSSQALVASGLRNVHIEKYYGIMIFLVKSYEMQETLREKKQQAMIVLLPVLTITLNWVMPQPTGMTVILETGLFTAEERTRGSTANVTHGVL